MKFPVRSSWLNFRCVPQSSPSIPLLICTAPYTTAAAVPSGGQRIVVMMIPTPIPISRTISSFSVHLLSICIRILVWMGLLSYILHNLVLHLGFVFSSLYSALSTLSNAGESLKYLLLLFYLFCFIVCGTLPYPACASGNTVVVVEPIRLFVSKLRIDVSLIFERIYPFLLKRFIYMFRDQSPCFSAISL